MKLIRTAASLIRTHRAEAFRWMCGICVVIALFPAIVLVTGSVVPFLFLVAAVPALVWGRHLEALLTFGAITIMVGGGVLGLVAIAMAIDADELLRHRKRVALTLAFGGAGIASELLYIHSEGVRTLFAKWAMVGPLLVGIAMAVRLYARRKHVTTDAA